MEIGLVYASGATRDSVLVVEFEGMVVRSAEVEEEERDGLSLVMVREAVVPRAGRRVEISAEQVERGAVVHLEMSERLEGGGMICWSMCWWELLMMMGRM